ncbi:unnamed protein product [Sphagnum balticum]
MLSCCTIADLKTDLEGCYGVKPCEQRLILEGKQLEDGKTLQECSVLFGSTLQLVARLRGGRAYCKPQLPRVSTDPRALKTSACPAVATPSTGRFFDMENTGSMMKIRLTKKAPLWRAAVEGLNVEGTCSNGECDAFGQMVICPMGFTVFNVAEECQCPICHEVFTPITCAFWKCTWMFEGRKRAGNIDMMSPWFDAGTKYVRFDEGEGHRNMTDWTNLIITAKEPRMIRTSVLHKRKSRANEAGCAICFEELMADDAGISMPNCEYMFHSECVRPWLLKDTCCSTCRNPLL